MRVTLSIIIVIAIYFRTLPWFLKSGQGLCQQYFNSMYKTAQDGETKGETSYKQASKLRHLSQEHSHLKSLVNFLEQINHKSRVLLKGVQDKTKNVHLNSTACSLGSVGTEPGLMDEDLNEIQQLVASLHSEIDHKKEELEQKAMKQEKSKIQDQILFRKMLYEYQNKLTGIKEEIKLREEKIQEMERLQKEGNAPVVDQKILGVFYSSFQLFDDMCFYHQQLKSTVANTNRLQEQIQKAKEEIKELQKVTFKLRVAKKARMPYHKFRSIVKHGVISMENEDKEDYAALMEVENGDDDLVGTLRSRVSGQHSVTPEMLYLIIRKEEMNKEILGKLIREENKKQEELLAQNELLKQAIMMKEQEEYFQEIDGKLKGELELGSQKDEETLSSHSLTRKHPNPKPITSPLNLCASDYHIYLDRLRCKVDELMAGYIPLGQKKSLHKSLSQKFIRNLREKPIAKSGDGTARFISQVSIFDQYNNIITDRFYGEEPEYEFIE